MMNAARVNITLRKLNGSSSVCNPAIGNSSGKYQERFCSKTATNVRNVSTEEEDVISPNASDATTSSFKRFLPLSLPWKSLTVSIKASTTLVEQPEESASPQKTDSLQSKTVGEVSEKDSEHMKAKVENAKNEVFEDLDQQQGQGGKVAQDSYTSIADISSYITRPLLSILPSYSRSKDTKSRFVRKPERRQMRAMTRSLCSNLLRCSDSLAHTTSLINRLQLLRDHLLNEPEQKDIILKEYEDLYVKLINWKSRHKNLTARDCAAELLALTGFVGAPKGTGLRVLALDGGGTRGLVTIQVLRELESQLKGPIHTHFDFICGVSTGGLIATMLTLGLDLNSAENLYKVCSKKMFTRSRLSGVSKLVTEHSYYDHVLWEKLLQENFGDRGFLETRRTPQSTMVAVVSTLMNSAQLKNYIFRNYTYRSGVESTYPGSPSHTFGNAIRASSAAPTYYKEKKINNDVHADGGLLTNNPSGIAVHEARLLWPGEKIQCLLSVGTGKFIPPPTEHRDGATDSSATRKVRSFVESATDVEGVHTILGELLPPKTYFRLNPYLSEEIGLDEVREVKWEAMVRDTGLYCRKNRQKIHAAATALSDKRALHQKVLDQMALRPWQPYSWSSRATSNVRGSFSRMRGTIGTDEDKN